MISEIDYNELLEIYSVAATTYNEIGNGTLKSLPMETFMRIDRAVSRAIIVAILVAKYDISEITEDEINLVIENLFNLLLNYHNSNE